MLIQFLNETIPVDKRNSVFIQLQAETDRSLISKADFFIANRDPRTVMRSEFADEYGVKILSAVDRQGF